ncbi:hypothetical protein KHP62_02075 [Rhodobacteraceae bacterium NNCM2]|nr:hypothetical protein [Coraliihabitans acroporae]
MFFRIMTVLLIGIAVFAASPRSLLQLSLETGVAEARGGGRGAARAGGFRGRGNMQPRGARMQRRPSRATRPPQTRHSNGGFRPSAGYSRPSTRPSTRPSNRPSGPQFSRPDGNRPTTLPSRPPSGRPEGGGGNRPGFNPPGDRPNRPDGKPGQRPPGARPPGDRLPGSRPPGNRPPGARPPGGRPPGVRPPGNRPPGWRPPGYHPPGHRPPGWRPPYYRPPYHRPPHYYWGSYYWYPAWGWYFTSVVAASTLVFVASLPEDNVCEEVLFEGETLYLCEGVLYRPVYHQDELVYEIVSEEADAPAPAAATEGEAAPAPAPAPAADPDVRIDEQGFRWTD